MDIRSLLDPADPSPAQALSGALPAPSVPQGTSCLKGPFVASFCPYSHAYSSQMLLCPQLSSLFIETSDVLALAPLYSGCRLPGPAHRFGPSCLGLSPLCISKSLNPVHCPSSSGVPNPGQGYSQFRSVPMASLSWG